MATVNIPDGVHVDVRESMISPKHTDPFWYHDPAGSNTLLSIHYKDRTVYMDAVGDVRIVFDDDRMVYGPQDLTQEEINMGDEWFKTVPDHCWVNNNWYELFYQLDGDQFVESFDDLVCYDYMEAWSSAVDAVMDDELWEGMNNGRR